MSRIFFVRRPTFRLCTGCRRDAQPLRRAGAANGCHRCAGAKPAWTLTRRCSRPMRKPRVLSGPMENHAGSAEAAPDERAPMVMPASGSNHIRFRGRGRTAPAARKRGRTRARRCSCPPPTSEAGTQLLRSREHVIVSRRCSSTVRLGAFWRNHVGRLTFRMSGARRPAAAAPRPIV